ncbi:hypothetical protein ACHWQZ_G014077 [Mnemiopsis leidyi]
MLAGCLCCKAMSTDKVSTTFAVLYKHIKELHELKMILADFGKEATVRYLRTKEKTPARMAILKSLTEPQRICLSAGSTNLKDDIIVGTF